MAYKFRLLPQAIRQLGELDEAVAQRVVKKLLWFAKQSDPLSFGIKLTNPAIGDIRFRIGDYRAIALVDAATYTVSIAAIGHRRDIYS